MLARGQQLIERLESRLQAQIDARLDARLAPEAAPDGSPFLIDVASHHLAVRGQRQRNRESRVARIGPHLDTAHGADQTHQQSHELSLLGADLHLRLRSRGSRRAQALQHLGLAHRGSLQIFVNVVG